MHDPMTVAFEIRYPWRDKPSQFFPKGYHQSFITIWHNDPESDGSDDSCGWFSPKLTKKQAERLKFLANSEARHPWFQKLKAKEISNSVEAESLLRGAFLMVSRILGKKISLEEATTWSIEMIHNDIDNYRSALCFRAGYHSNSEEDSVQHREYAAERFFYSLGRYILREKRWWFNHPRWHFWHWSFQIHPLQKIRRRLFDRCAHCGKGFAKNETPIGTWSGDKIFHSNCDQQSKPSCPLSAVS